MRWRRLLELITLSTDAFAAILAEDGVYQIERKRGRRRSPPDCRKRE